MVSKTRRKPRPPPPIVAAMAVADTAPSSSPALEPPTEVVEPLGWWGRTNGIRSVQPPPSPPDPLTVEVTLTGADSDVIRRLAEEEYRTPAQQVGYVVHQALRGQVTDLLRAAIASSPPFAINGSPASTNGHAPAPLPPSPPLDDLIPVWHNGAKGGCGKVGLLFARKIGRDGDTIGPADVFKLDRTRLTSGGLVCGVCGEPMGPATWSYPDDE